MLLYTYPGPLNELPFLSFLWARYYALWRAVVLTLASVPRGSGHTRHADVATVWVFTGAGGVPQPAVRARNASARWFQQQLVQTSTT